MRPLCRLHLTPLVHFSRRLASSRSPSEMSKGRDKVDLADYRRSYQPSGPLLESHAADGDPWSLFDAWFKHVDQLARAGGATFEEVNAFALSTVDKEKGMPSCRMLLCKSYSESGLTFFTSSTSRKGSELSANPNACALFYWPSVNRQVRMQGTCSRLPSEEVDVYWQRRPLASRASAAASAVLGGQSSIIGERQQLEEAKCKIMEGASSADANVPRPADWSGYVLKPDEIEFWQGGADRLHDRLTFTRTEDEWTIRRLAP